MVQFTKRSAFEANLSRILQTAVTNTEAAATETTVNVSAGKGWQALFQKKDRGFQNVVLARALLRLLEIRVNADSVPKGSRNAFHAVYLDLWRVVQNTSFPESLSDSLNSLLPFLASPKPNPKEILLSDLLERFIDSKFDSDGEEQSEIRTLTISLMFDYARVHHAQYAELFSNEFKAELVANHSNSKAITVEKLWRKKQPEVSWLNLKDALKWPENYDKIKLLPHDRLDFEIPITEDVALAAQAFVDAFNQQERLKRGEPAQTIGAIVEGTRSAISDTLLNAGNETAADETRPEMASILTHMKLIEDFAEAQLRTILSSLKDVVFAKEDFSVVRIIVSKINQLAGIARVKLVYSEKPVNLTCTTTLPAMTPRFDLKPSTSSDQKRVSKVAFPELHLQKNDSKGPLGT